jgi:long-chain acyl-CoA synthetase
MSRYLNNAEATDEVSQFGWHHSGDLGMIDSEGQLLFVDRKKDMIKSGGENVPSCKVEQVLLGIPGVIQVAVFGVPHPRWSEAVCAALQLAPGAALDEEQVIAHCKQHLGRFEVPKRVLFVEALPLTGTGKVRKTELRQQYAELFSEETTA